jgi:protein-disulfide isomerase
LANVTMLGALVWFTAGPKGWARPSLNAWWEKVRADAVAERRLPLLVSEGLQLDKRDDGTTTVVVFTDYECPACRAVESVLDSARMARPDLRVVIQPYPTVSNPFAEMAALGTLCAEQRGQFSAAHHALMTTHEWMRVGGVVRTLAQRLGGSEREWGECISASGTRQRLAQGVKRGQGIVIEGLPTMVGRAGRIAGKISAADLGRILGE